ncbi:MAG: hypothetical protein MUF49_08345 [Oculatellaceae cyanobacterium Prado106]|jgi:hypothetical protein|nr:hypothetical protein [Oculatellaceae cyanobacterium Prado106]
MTNQTSVIPSFLRDAFESHASFSNLQKQDVQKRALKWLQLHINDDLADKTIMEQFTQKWRVGPRQTLGADQSPLHLDVIPGSYSKSPNNHQEEALVFLQEVVPLQLQEDFKQRWNAKNKLEVSNKSGTSFKIDERKMELLQQEDPDGCGITWHHVESKQVYYLLSSEEKGENLLVVLAEEIGSENRNTWFVSQKDVKVSPV